MIKEDELILWKNIWKEINKGIKYPDYVEIGKLLGIPNKRINFILQKWNDRGLMNCGVSPRSGWIEEGITEDSINDW